MENNQTLHGFNEILFLPLQLHSGRDLWKASYESVTVPVKAFCLNTPCGQK